MAGLDPDGVFSVEDFRRWLPWLAGLYEGEGCVRLHYRSASSAQLALTIGMTDRDVLESARARAQMGHVTGPYSGDDSRKPMWKWQVGKGEDAYALAVAMWPLLHDRRREQLNRRVGGWLEAQRTATKRPTVAERFWAFVDQSGPIPETCPELGNCWEWLGSMTTGNYGQLHPAPGEKSVTAHRFSWTLQYGEPEAGANIMIRCGNRRCVRPAHLRNTMLECPNGHILTEENSLSRKERARLSGRRCRQCQRAARMRSLERERLRYQEQARGRA